MINGVNKGSLFYAGFSKKEPVKKEQEIQSGEQKQSEKVSKIAQAIKDGSYQIDTKKTAQALLDTLV